MFDTTIITLFFFLVAVDFFVLVAIAFVAAAPVFLEGISFFFVFFVFFFLAIEETAPRVPATTRGIPMAAATLVDAVAYCGTEKQVLGIGGKSR